MRVWRLRFIAALVFYAPEAAGEDRNCFNAPTRDCLVLGPEAEGDNPILWEFDPRTGKTMGSSFPLTCLRSDLVFEKSGALRRAVPPASDDTCSQDQHINFRWRLLAIDGVQNVEISGSDLVCPLQLKFQRRPSPALVLTDGCSRRASHPSEFRYFPKAP